MKSVRLGCGLAFWGDSIQPAIEMVERGDIDYLCCDHLAELTMSILTKQKARDPELGYTTRRHRPPARSAPRRAARSRSR